MKVKEIAIQALDIQKGAIASWYDAVSILQDHAVLAADTLLDQTTWIPDEGRKVLSSWAETCKNERDRYKVYMEEGFSVLEKHLAQDMAGAPAGPDRPAAEAKTVAAVEKPKAADVEEKKAPAAQNTK